MGTESSAPLLSRTLKLARNSLLLSRGLLLRMGYEALCFNPRHGIRVTRNEKQEDFVICFQCAQVEVFGEVNGRFLIANSAQALFDSVLQSSGIPRAVGRNAIASLRDVLFDKAKWMDGCVTARQSRGLNAVYR